jgi:hypothetical protein
MGEDEATLRELRNFYNSYRDAIEEEKGVAVTSALIASLEVTRNSGATPDSWCPHWESGR